MTTSTTPNNTQAERSLLGSILIDQDILNDIELNPGDFYDRRNAIVAEAIRQVHGSNMAVDNVTIAENIMSRGKVDDIGGLSYISELYNATPTSVNADSYFEIVDRMAMLRSLSKAGAEIVDIARRIPEDAERALDEAEKTLFQISSKRRVSRWSDAQALMAVTQGRIQSIVRDGIRQGVTSGISGIDGVTGGWQKSDLIILAARPSVGKTALATSMALSAARSGKKVAIFSVEMSAEQVGARILSSASGVPLQAIRHGGLDMMQLVEIDQWAQRVSELGIYVDDSPVATPSVIRSKCRKISAEHGIDLVIVDYLQLMSPDKGNKDANRVNEVADISRALKALARELDVPVIALSQLSRMSEYRETGEPRLSDLRDSGAIEQDADVVLMLWRKEQPDFTRPVEGVSCKIAKHRNGATGICELEFMKSTASFRG
jgi:replicative DNA helicase